ncbi:MAG TPA: ABC transporter substrate-binding protein [Candidatus Hydrogenedentes bacterium]|nr:ABC transporter substrate-binding protein [Candidatus Hydrogenedentota bacterium]HPG67531.1 ABC transporter substrate-binding protein [Candidatus Hydrogenedentota bacterium]
MKKLWLVLMITVVAVGCGAPKQDSGTSGGTAPETAAKAADDELVIAVVPKGLAHQFWLTVKAGAEAAGAEFGAEILWQGPAKETEVDKQINIIEDMIGRNVDAIVMAACDENALVDVIQEAIDAGIPVVTIDSGVQSDIPVSFVATDNIEGAKAAARELARLVGEEGNVGLVPFVKGAATSEMREQGFKEGIQEFPNIELVSVLYSESDAAKGMAVTEDMMTSHPDLKGVFAASEPTAVGVAQAVSAAGKAGQVKVVGFDASDQEIEDLKKGIIQALVVQNPYRMGYEGVKAAIDHLAGKEVPKRVDTGVVVVTIDNFESPEIQKILYPLKDPNG